MYTMYSFSRLMSALKDASGKKDHVLSYRNIDGDITRLSVTSRQFQRGMWELRKQAQAHDALYSRYQGWVGDVLTRVVRIMYANEFPGKVNEQTYHVYTLKDAEGHIYVYHGPVKLGDGFDRFQRVRIRARVKQHKLFNGIEETVLTDMETLDSLSLPPTADKSSSLVYGQA